MGTKTKLESGMYIYNFAKELVKEPDMEIHLLSDIATSNEMQAMERREPYFTVTVHRSEKILGWLNITAICKK